ncbi:MULTISPECIES: TetR/AcrR family transcriptional regulator [Pseudarthrobacter]|jgi:AcrR family transcriptional regulator|uniref:TetR/AcrR family transcriptional regulator n=1 Tax=Pseudarthrobacter TaxID=1742993 RepID=UPI0013D8EF4D|nr:MULTISPECIES: TetR/AcrR family transcriptional regulator [Pseudarthrobacter]MDP9997110.1 AcrR family transcriptional regulator [Pseudarthrobacter sulfonivorans]QOD04017.1 TetR/AcrR family transcriptional regulator [Pseudarthrobacter sp. BIM B-2242]
MPRISAATNAAQRAETQRRILTAFGELLFTHGLPGLTMTDVARHAGVGRTAVYNYYADIEELLISYALDETERFLAELRDSLAALENPVERLALYVRTQVEDLSRRHLPPGPAMAAVLSPSSFAKLADHVGELSVMLQGILRDGMAQGYLPEADIAQQAQLIHGTLSSSAARGSNEPAELEARIARTVRFIQLGAGARFNDDGTPLRVV